MEWIYLSIPKFQRLHCWSLGVEKSFHPTLYNGYNYLSMLRLKLIHVSKKGASALSVGCFHQYRRITVSGTLCFEHILNIVADILQKTFSDAFSLIKIMIFDSNFKEGCSQGSSWQCTSTNSCLLLKSDRVWPQHKLIWDPGCPDFIENYIQNHPFFGSKYIAAWQSAENFRFNSFCLVTLHDIGDLRQH